MLVLQQPLTAQRFFVAFDFSNAAHRGILKLTEYTYFTRTLTVMKSYTNTWTTILLILSSSILGIKGYDDDDIFNPYVTYRYDKDDFADIFRPTITYDNDDFGDIFRPTISYDRNINTYTSYRNNSSSIAGIIVAVVILKIVLLTCYIVRRQRLRRVTVFVSEPIAVRVSAQTRVNPPASGTGVPYATPYAAHGFPKYPPHGHNYDAQPPYNPNLGHPSTAGQVPPPYEEAAPPPYELPCDPVDVPDNTKLIASTNK